MPALIAVIRKAERRVHLDPAFGLGDGVTCSEGDEVRLLRTSEFGHLEEHAQVVASMLRRSGWRVRVRDCSSLQPRPVATVGETRRTIAWTPTEVRAVAQTVGNSLLEHIGEIRQDPYDPTKSYRPPEPLAPPDDQDPTWEPRKRRQRATRHVCLTCGHPTTRGQSQNSHIKNVGHTEFQETKVEDIPALQEQIHARADQQAGTPEPTGSASSASEAASKGYTHPEQSAALQRPPDGSAS